MTFLHACMFSRIQEMHVQALTKTVQKLQRHYHFVYESRTPASHNRALDTSRLLSVGTVLSTLLHGPRDDATIDFANALDAC